MCTPFDSLPYTRSADTNELRAHGITFTLQPSGPDDGEMRVMIHVSGTNAIAPSSIACPDVEMPALAPG